MGIVKKTEDVMFVFICISIKSL